MTGVSQTLVDALCAAIKSLGGHIRLSTPVEEIIVEGGRVVGVRSPRGIAPADAVISTMPTPLVSSIVPDLSEDWKAKYDAIKNIGVCCVLFKLKKSVTPHFWVNINEPGIAIPGIIEFSNLRPVDHTVIFVPYYMPVNSSEIFMVAEATFGRGVRLHSTHKSDS